MNSLVIVLFLSGMVAMIMLRTLHKDIARYNQMDSAVCQTFGGIYMYDWDIDQAWGEDGWMLAKFFYCMFIGWDGP